MIKCVLISSLEIMSFVYLKNGPLLFWVRVQGRVKFSKISKDVAHKDGFWYIYNCFGGGLGKKKWGQYFREGQADILEDTEFGKSLEATPNLSAQLNSTEKPEKVKDASINSYEKDQSECFTDKKIEKAKFNRLKTITLKSIT